MADLTLTQIARTLNEAGLPPSLDEDEARLLIRILRLVAKGRPVSSQQVEEATTGLQIPFDSEISFIRSISEYDGDDNIVGMLGLSQNAHPHRFEVNGCALSTWCAWDSLFLPGLLDQRAEVKSLCPATGTTIRVTLTPEKILQLHPTSAVVSIVTPDTAEKKYKSVEDIWKIFCCQVHFFSSVEAASGWFAEKPQRPLFLSVKDGFQLGRMVFGKLIDYT